MTNTANLQSSFPGPKIMLVGETGTGKTHATRTLIDAGLETFCIFTEPGMEVVADIPCEKGMHFHYIAPSSPDWAAMIDSATKINTMSFEFLTKMGDVNKKSYTEFIDLLQTMSNFKCDRCGQAFGPVDAFGPNRAVVIDSLSGLNIMAMNLVTGSKPVKSMADWGVAMDNLERFITKFTTDVKCTGVLIAHLEREADEVTGGVQLMASTLGKKLAPRIPRFFSDVIHCKREGEKYEWSTATMNVALKARNVPINDHIPPTFVPILNGWRKKAGIAS